MIRFTFKMMGARLWVQCSFKDKDLVLTSDFNSAQVYSFDSEDDIFQFIDLIKTYFGVTLIPTCLPKKYDEGSVKIAREDFPTFR